jgi:hypothetical protein
VRSLSLLAAALLLQLQAAAGFALDRPAPSGCEAPIFSAKVSCVGEGSGEGVWLSITEDTGADPTMPLHVYTIRLSRLEHGFETTSYEKKLGEGGWCHVLFRGIDANLDSPREQRNQRFIFVWVEGQKSSAYVFGIANKGLIPLFEKSEGRGQFACRDVDGDDVYEVLEEDSAWHIRSDQLPKRMLAKLKGAAAGRFDLQAEGRQIRSLRPRACAGRSESLNGRGIGQALRPRIAVAASGRPPRRATDRVDSF